jgi:hypothetical protein
VSGHVFQVGGIRGQGVPVPSGLCVPLLLALVPRPATTTRHPVRRLWRAAESAAIHRSGVVLGMPALFQNLTHGRNYRDGYT